MAIPRSRARNWRAADLRGDGPEPRSVREVVQRVWLSLFAARWSESALFGVAALLVTLAAAELSLEDRRANGRFGVAVVAGLFSALAWGLEHRERPRDVARRLDRRMRHDGALFTAWELEARGRTGGADGATRMGALLRRRVLSRLRTREAVRALHPPLALPLAAPLFAWGLLSFAQDLRGEDARPGADVQALTEGGALVLRKAWMGSLYDVNGEDERLAMRELAKVEEELRRLALRKLQAGEEVEPGEDESGDWRAELDELDAQLANIGLRLAENDALSEAIEQARNALDAARMGAALAGASASDGAGSDGAGTEGSGPELAGGGESGTMGGQAGGQRPGVDPDTPIAAPETDVSSGSTGSSGATRLPAEVGAGTGRWWDPAQDGVVEHWLELRRLALEGPG